MSGLVGGAWRINVPARTGIKRGWLVLRDGEPACPFRESEVHPSRQSARNRVRGIMVLRKLAGKGMGLRPRVVPCTLVLGWAP